MYIFAAESGMPGWAIALVSIIGAIASAGLGGWIINLYTTKKKENREDTEQSNKVKLAENQQAFDLYKEIVNTLRSDVKDLNTHLNSIEKEHIQCREENAKLTNEVGHLKSRMDLLDKQINLRVGG